MNSDISTQIAAAAALSFVINLLKSSKSLPWISKESERLNRLVALLGSGLVSLGLHAHFDHQAGTLLITGISLQAIALGLWHWLTQFACTHGWYKATSRPDVQALVKQALLEVLSVQVPPAAKAAAAGKKE